jgi:hypothetical protein
MSETRDAAALPARRQQLEPVSPGPVALRRREERVCPLTTTGHRLLSMSPPMRRFTQLCVDEYRRQLLGRPEQ